MAGASGIVRHGLLLKALRKEHGASEAGNYSCGGLNGRNTWPSCHSSNQQGGCSDVGKQLPATWLGARGASLGRLAGTSSAKSSTLSLQRTSLLKEVGPPCPCVQLEKRMRGSVVSSTHWAVSVHSTHTLRHRDGLCCGTFFEVNSSLGVPDHCHACFCC